MKILVVRLSSLGDILHLFPALSDLRRHYPDAVIHWLVEPGFAEVVSWHEAVDRVITVPLRAHKKVWWKIPILLGKLRRQLQSARYDVVLDAQGLLKSAVLARLAGVAVYGFDLVNCARDQFLAGSAFAGDQDSRTGGCALRDQAGRPPASAGSTRRCFQNDISS